MKIRRGSNAGKSATLVQFANDWVMIDLDGRSKIARPTSLQVETDAERQAFESSKDRQDIGTFWQEWDLLDDGTFRRKR